MSIDIFQVDIYNVFIKNINNIINYPTIVIDLRNNGGGSLDDTRAMLDHIVPQDAPIYHTVSNDIQTSLLSQ
jgi:C-terminal processing protease CtpA/Prc